MSRMMEMEAFATVVEEGGFTLAARKLGVSKSAVSKHVSALEARLGARLLTRTTRRVAPTEIGAVYYDRASRILNDAGVAEALVGEMQSSPSGALRITSPRDFGIHRLSPRLGGFLDRYPDITVQLDLTDQPTDLVADGYDLAIRVGKQPDSSLRARKLTSYGSRLVASPKYLAAQGAPETLQDLERHRLLAGSNTVWSLCDTNAATTRLRVSPTLCVNDGQTQLNAAVEGLGIAYLPDFLTDRAVVRGDLQVVLPQARAWTSDVYAVFAPGDHTPPKLRAFLDHISAAFCRNASSAG